MGFMVKKGLRKQEQRVAAFWRGENSPNSRSVKGGQMTTSNLRKGNRPIAKVGDFAKKNSAGTAQKLKNHRDQQPTRGRKKSGGLGRSGTAGAKHMEEATL